MSIFSRVNDMAAANLADLVDRAEDPVKMIKLAIMEMEEALIDARSNAAGVIANRKEMIRSIAQLTAVEADWRAKADMALSKDREDLATAALTEGEKALDRAARLHHAAADLDLALADAEADIGKLSDKLSEARTKQAAMMARIDTANSRVRVREAFDGTVARHAMRRFEVLDQRVDFA